MVRVSGAVRVRTLPSEEPGPSTPVEASGVDFAAAYEALRGQVPADHLLLYVLVD